MEEIEQICTRIAIMDKGKTLAMGTKEELKAMIRSAETVHVEIFDLSDAHLHIIESQDSVSKVHYQNNFLEIHYSGGKNNLMQLLNYLQNNGISFGRVTSEEPTLNDVFLEITGKELRD